MKAVGFGVMMRARRVALLAVATAAAAAIRVVTLSELEALRGASAPFRE